MHRWTRGLPAEADIPPGARASITWSHRGGAFEIILQVSGGLAKMSRARWRLVHSSCKRLTLRVVDAESNITEAVVLIVERY